VGALSRTSTGRVVDPMITKLEMMVGYLAGKQGKAAETIRRELDEPTSEANRWLEAIQKRSRAIVRSSPSGLPGPRDLISLAPMPNGMATRAPSRKRLLPFLYSMSAASAVFLALGVAWRAQETRLHRIEAMLNERDAWLGTRFEQLTAALAKPGPASQGSAPISKPSVAPQSKPSATADESTGLALARIEARLGEVGERLRESQSSQNQSDPMIDELRRDVDRLRKEVEARAQASRQESHELGSVVQEVLQLLRGVAMRPWGQDPMQVPVPGSLQERLRRGGQGPGLMPGPEQVPGQGPMFEQDRLRPDAGRGDRDGWPQGRSGGFPGSRMQRPGGPG